MDQGRGDGGGVTMPTVEEFRDFIAIAFGEANKNGQTEVILRAGDVHQQLGGYPKKGSHQMPSCCVAMTQMMRTGDCVLQSPPKGKGANLVIRYKLPRA